jgi:hypothetical protein
MKKLAALIFVLLFTFLQCTNNTPLPNGYDLLEREGKVGLQEPVTIQPVNMARFWRSVPAGEKATLLLGTGKETQSFIIFQNLNLKKISSSATVLSAKLAMYAIDHFGDKSPFSFTAHRVERVWDEREVKWENVENGFRSDVLETWEYTPVDSAAWQYFQFTDINFITEWIADSYNATPSINGLILKFDQAPGGTIFQSTEGSSYTPYIQIISQSGEEVDTTIAYFTHDASLLMTTNGVAEDELEENPDVLYVGNGMGYRSVLQFDFSELPVEATIHKAKLTFYIDPDNVLKSDADTDGAFSVGIGVIDSLAEWQGLTMVDSLLALEPKISPGVDIATIENESFSFDSPAASVAVARIVQRWVSGNYPNHGFLLYPYYQATDFQEMAFKAGLMDVSKIPTLEITYSLPAAHRFAQ